MSQEQTFVMIKPDGVQRGLIAQIINRFEQRGYKLIALKMDMPTQQHIEQHYSDLSSKPFFAGLVKYMVSGPVVPMVWEGKDVVKQVRQMLGETNPLASKPGSIRGDFSIETGRNIIHASDSVESAQKEIQHWFKSNEIMQWQSVFQNWVYE